MANLLPCAFLVLLAFTKLCVSTFPDNPHIAHDDNVTNAHRTSWIGEDASAPERHSQYVRTENAFAPNIEGLLADYYAGNRPINPAYKNPHFIDIETLQKKLAYRDSVEGLIMRDYRVASPYQDHHPMHSIPEYDVAPLKKHDFGGGGQNYGGWDMFPPGGLNLGHGGSGFAQVGQTVKKGKEAKALFALMAPLILLAVFGPILATQAMIPWVANGGLTSVSTIAGSTGKRKKRSPYDPRQMAELEKRLQLFLEVQDFIARSGSTSFAEEMGEAFLRCQKYSGRRNKCLERISCEYSDETSNMDPAERRIAKMVFQNVMSNPIIPAAVKGRLSKGSMFGRNHKRRCRNYWCEAIDGFKTNS